MPISAEANQNSVDSDRKQSMVLPGVQWGLLRTGYALGELKVH